MASLPDGITLDIPDLRVTITPRSDYIVTIQPVDEYHVVTFDTPTVTRATSIFVDYAQSASYANNAGSAVSASYAEVSATSSYADNFVVVGGVTASAFVGDGSQLTGITAQGTGITVRDDGTLSGVSQILDFTDGLDVSFVSSTSSISLNRTGSFSGTFSGSQVITGQLTASGLTYPTTDGDAYQMVMTDGAGVLRLDYADRLTLDVKNLDSVQLNKGTPVYIVGFQGDGIYQIAAADASDSDKMPAVGLLADTLAVNDQGHCVLYGALRGINTQTRSVGDELFVDSGGGLTGSAPSYPALIQKIATVGNVANNGELTILGAGRTNAVPNLATGQIFYGVDNKASTISVTDLLSSNSYIYTGSFTGSFVGDGSGLTDIVSASFATTASYVEGAASDWDTLANKPSGLVSSSVQINTGSFSGSFTGDGSGLTGLVSASHALTSDTTISSSYSVTASYADNAGVSDWNELTNVPSGLVSSSTQTIANINGQEITPSIISSSGHIVPSITEIYDLGSTDLRWRDLYLSGSTIYLGNAQLSSIGQLLSGSFTGSFTGDASSITGVVSSSYALTASYADNAANATNADNIALTADNVNTNRYVPFTATANGDGTLLTDAGLLYNPSNNTLTTTTFNGDLSGNATTATTATSANSVEYSNVANKPTLISSSTQVNADSVTNFDTNVKDKLNADGVISSSAQVTITESQITDLNHYDNTDNLTYLNSLGVISSSAQVDYDSIQNVPSGIVSSSGQVDYAGLSNIPSGIVSSSTQVDYDSIQNVPSGILSASSFTSPSQGTVRATINGVQTDVDTGLQTGDSPQFTNLTLSGDLTVNGTTTYISSSQVDIGDQIITLNANNAAGDGGIYVNDTSTNETGSLLWDVSENYWIGGLLGSESELITLTSLNAKGVISSSGQVDYTGLSNIPSGIVSSSQQINTGSFSGSFSGDGSGLTGVTGVGSGVEIRDDGAIRGTAQILDFVDGIDATFASSTASISLNRTGSFTGSFSGDGSGLTSLTADTATSADTASYLNPLQQLVRITGSVDVAQGNLVLDDNAYFLYGTNTSDTSVSLIGVNGSDIVEIGNQGFDINMVDDVIIDGFVSASSYISASTFSGDGSNLTGIDTDQVTEATNLYYTDARVKTKLNADGVFSSSAQVNADSVTNFDSNVLTYINSLGAVSSSSQIDHDQTTNYSADEHFTQANITTLGTVTSGDVSTILPTGTLSSSAQIDGSQVTGVISSSYALTASSADNVIINSYTTTGDNRLVTSVDANSIKGEANLKFDATNLFITGGIKMSGEISSSNNITASAFSGDGSNITGVISSSYALTASYAANGGGGGGGVTINNNTDNYLVTATGTADTLDGESNLTFNGNDLGVSGSLLMHATASGANDMITMTSGSTQGIIRVGDGNFQLDAGSQALRLTRSDSTIIQDGSSFRTISSLDLGTDGQRWGRLYITDVSASGEVSASSFIGDGSQVTGVVTSSYSNTASYVETAQTASYFIGDISFPSGLEVTGSLLLDGSMSASGDVTASAFTGDGSNITGVVSSSHALDADNAISASYAVTASHALNAGGGGVTINNNVDTYLVTATGTADTLDGESKLTFDGTTFNVDGAFTAQTKSFLIDHQSQPGKKLIYGVLEGPEHAVYLRGKLINDDTITFPEEWSWLVDKDTITVQLTPIGSYQQLWVEQITDTSITVNSNTDINCYYLVHATRKDVDPLETVE